MESRLRTITKTLWVEEVNLALNLGSLILNPSLVGIYRNIRTQAGCLPTVGVPVGGTHSLMFLPPAFVTPGKGTATFCLPEIPSKISRNN